MLVISNFIFITIRENCKTVSQPIYNLKTHLIFTQKSLILNNVCIGIWSSIVFSYKVRFHSGFAFPRSFVCAPLLIIHVPLT